MQRYQRTILEIEIIYKPRLGSQYYRTPYSDRKKLLNVVNINDCIDYVLKPQIGDVIVNGNPFISSLGGLKGKLLTNYQGKIDKLAIRNDKPYHIFGKGWFSLDNLR